MSQLMAEYRRKADDRFAPYLVDDDELVDLLNEAMDEACIRAKLLTDSTSNFCNLALTDATQTAFQLDPRILEVTAARIDGIHDPLRRVAYEDFLQRRDPPEQAGSPRWYAVDGMPLAGLTLYLDRPLDPARYVGAFLRLTVKRRQLTPLTLPVTTGGTPSDPIPEIAEPLHRSLVYWPVALAFESRDTDQTDQQRAEKAMARFEAVFGVRPDANVLRKRLKHQAPVCTPDGPAIGTVLPIRRRYHPFVEP